MCIIFSCFFLLLDYVLDYLHVKTGINDVGAHNAMHAACLCGWKKKSVKDYLQDNGKKSYKKRRLDIVEKI